MCLCQKSSSWVVRELLLLGKVGNKFRFCPTPDLLIFFQLETSTLLKVHCVMCSPSDTAKAWGIYFIL